MRRLPLRVRQLWFVVSGTMMTTAALSGPVLVYREGEACPRDRPADAARLSETQVIARARALLPRDFCGPSHFVSGCDFEPEAAFDSWRVYVRQYKEADGARRYGGLDHSYVVLDAVGNCVANIPGT